MANQDPKPTVDGDQLVAPERPKPQDTVGSEGGASLVGTPRHVETDADNAGGDRDGQRAEVLPEDD